MSRNAMKKTRRSDDGHLEPAEIGVSEFKQRCLQILDELGPEGIVVTKRGKPVARVLPAIEGHGAFIGVLRGRPIKVCEDDDLFSTGAWVSDEWGDLNNDQP
jgi:prevent-host-death family protein